MIDHATLFLISGFVIACVTFAGLLYLALRLARFPTDAEYTTRVQLLTSILTLLLGTAASLAGAYSALKVATLGLRLAEQQYEQSSSIFIDARLEEATGIYKEIGVGLSRYYLAANLLADAYGDSSSIDAEARFRASQQFTSANSQLKAALERLSRSTVAVQCFTRQPEVVAVPATSVAPADAPDLRSMASVIMTLENAQMRIERSPHSSVAKASRQRFQTTAVHPEVSADRDLVRLVFAGALLSANDRGEGFENTGMALLVNLMRKLPATDQLKSCLRTSYPSLAAAVANSLIDFDPMTAVAASLQNAATAVAMRQALLHIEAPK